MNFPLINLKDAEKRAFRSYFKDGIWDLYLGVLLLNMGLAPVVANFLEDRGYNYLWSLLVMLLTVTVAFLLFFFGKKYITTPRIGRVKFGPQRRKKVNIVRFLMALSVLIGIVLLFVPIKVFAGLPVPAYIFAVNCFVMFGLGAYYLDFGRLYLYGPMIGLSFPLTIILSDHMDLSFDLSSTIVYGAFSLVMILIGVVIFIRFLKENPLLELPEEEA